MDTFVLDAQASEVRGELLKERKKRFELEAKLRMLEQQMAQTTLATRTGSFEAPKRQQSPVDRLNSGSPVNSTSTATNGSHQSSSLLNGARTLNSSDALSEMDVSSQRSDLFDLEAEREWLNSVHVPNQFSRPKPGTPLNSSQNGSDISSVVGEEGELERNQLETDDLDYGLGPSLSQYGGKMRYPSRDHYSSNGSPTLGGHFALSGDLKTLSSVSPLPLQEMSRRRYDDSSVRVSQLKIEVAEYKKVMAEMSSDLKISKVRVESLFSQLVDAQSSLELLREQVRDKNRRILELMEENKSVASLKAALEVSNGEKISLAVELSTLQRAHQASLESEDLLKKQLEKLELVLKGRDSEVSEKNETMAKMAEKLMELKMQLQAIVPHLCKFSVSTVVRFGKPVVVSIGVLKPNAERQRELEIVTAGKRVTHPASFVVSIAASATNKDRFMVTYRNGNTDTFDSNRRTEVVSSLNQQLFGTPDTDEN